VLLYTTGVRWDYPTVETRMLLFLLFFVFLGVGFVLGKGVFGWGFERWWYRGELNGGAMVESWMGKL
jgi:hypothetical protein